ncbi:MAG TPA: hypothetical protein VFA07_14220 [Chthonomonadaceae bacterium]|nr:hypothetical protein [Chthonomonadaceae bacterium]
MHWSIRRTLPRSPWAGIGPAALMLTLAGVGVSTIISSVRAQEAASVAPKPIRVTVTVGTAPLKLQGSVSSVSKTVTVVGRQDVAVQPPPTLETPSVEPQDKEGQSSEDQRQLRRQLRDLMKQRADLDSRIADLQRRLGDNNDIFYRGALGGSRLGDKTYFVAPFVDRSRKLTPEERKQAEEAMKQAQEAMRTAQKAMEQAQKAMGDNATIYRDYMPQIQEHLRALEVPNAIPDLPDVHVYSWSPDDQKRFQQDWAKQQPEFERAMRDFQARMQKWAEDFEARMRREFGTREGDRLAPPADKPKETTPQKENNGPDKDQDTGGDIL